MRFIARDERTERHLEGRDLISNPREVIKIRHFFHNRGTILQKSFEGLLRSILFQMLDAAPQLSHILRPIYEKILTRHTKTLWTSSNLRKCLNNLLRQSVFDMSVFILLDALDEFDGTPNHISDFLEDLLRSAGDRTRVQILFSSRPWETFHERFQDARYLHLQEHNQSDIATYCTNTILDQEARLRPLLHPLIPEIVRRAEGVFIWVKYTLEGLLTAATQGKDAEDLVTVLDSIPTDLADYYTSVVRRIKRKDRRDAYVLFQLVVSRSEGHGLDSMDVIFAHFLWDSKTFADAQSSFTTLMTRWVPDSMKTRFKAGTAFAASFERNHRFVRPRFLINRYGTREEFNQRKGRITQLSGGLVHITQPAISSRKDMVQVHIDKLVEQQIVPRRTAMARKPLATKFTEEDQEPFFVEPSHQTVYEFIKRPGFKDLILDKEADLFHENRYTWFTKMFLAQGLLQDAGTMCLLSELTTGRSMADFLDSIPRETWRTMYENDFLDEMKSSDILIDSPLRFAVIYGLTLYLKDSNALDNDVIRTTKEDLMLIAPLGFGTWKEIDANGRWKLVTDGEVNLRKHLDITQIILESGYNPDMTRSAFLKILWIIGALSVRDHIHLRGQYYERWHTVATEAKAALLIEFGQDPNVQLSGVRTRFFEAKGNSRVKWRPVHVASLAFTKKLHGAGADLNGEDGDGNTPLDWLLAPWDTSKGRKVRGLAHRLTEDLDYDAERDRWGKIAYLIQNGGVAKTTPARVWHSFTSRHFEQLPRQSVSVVRQHSPDSLQDSTASLNNPVPKDKDSSLSSRMTGSTLTATATGFSDVVTRTEAGNIVTYTNLGNDGNLLDSYFQDLELAVGHCSRLTIESSKPEVKKENRGIPWRSRG